MLRTALQIAQSMVLFLTICSAGTTWASAPPKDTTCSPLEQQTLTDGWFGLSETLAEEGISVGLGLTQIYQQNIHGGLSTHRRAGRYAGSYDLELEFDLETLLNLSGGSLYVLAEGSWSEGIDGPAVGSIFGVNGDAGRYRSIDITQLYYEQSLFDEALKVRVGKTMPDWFRHAEQCTACRACEERCPFHLHIIEGFKQSLALGRKVIRQNRARSTAGAKRRK